MIYYNQKIAKIGENISIRRFSRYEVGEGIEKKEENFAEEVAKANAIENIQKESTSCSLFLRKRDI